MKKFFFLNLLLLLAFNVAFGQPRTISGTVFNDENGNTRINGTEIGSTAGTNLYVHLVNSAGIVVDEYSVLPAGTFTLTGVINTTYNIELSTISYGVGNDINTSPISNTLPLGWYTTGENGNNNTGNGDGWPNGVLEVTAGTGAKLQQNFGFTTLQPISCNASAYQVAGNQGSNSTLYSYNVSTGSRAVISALGYEANAIGYSVIDNMIWGYDRTSSRVARIDAVGKSIFYDVPNLPNGDFNVGSVFGEGYLFLYYSSTARFYVVDIDPSRATFAQMVQPATFPATGYVIDVAPYGQNLVNGVTSVNNTLNISDIAYNATTGMLYGVIDPGSANEYRVVTINPTTGINTVSATISGGGIQTEASGYGSVFTDAFSDKLYVFANSQGRFYEINLTSNVATLLSTSATANNNDGTNCPNVRLPITIAGTVYLDANGVTDGEVFGNPENLEGSLIAILYNNTLNVVADTLYINSDGEYDFTAIQNNSYTVYISTTEATIGQSALPTITLPENWVNVGEVGNAATGTGSDLLADGHIVLGMVNESVLQANFGIEQRPETDDKFWNITNIYDPITGTVRALDVGIPYVLGGYSETGPELFSGSDPEYSPAPGSINDGTGTTFVINTIPPPADAVLYYDWDGDGPNAPVVIIALDSIINFKPELLSIIFQRTDLVVTSFEYVTIDPATKRDLSPAIYTINFLVTLPVTGLQLTANSQPNGIVQLNWSTITEVNTSHFDVLVSKDGNAFVGVKKVEAAGYSTGSKYQYNYLANGYKYYKIRLTDKDGKVNYSNIVLLNAPDRKGIKVYPVPAQTNITITGIAAGSTVQLYNSEGKLIKQVVANTSNVQLLLSDLQTGHAWIRVLTNGRLIHVEKILKMGN